MQQIPGSTQTLDGWLWTRGKLQRYRFQIFQRGRSDCWSLGLLWIVSHGRKMKIWCPVCLNYVNAGILYSTRFWVVMWLKWVSSLIDISSSAFAISRYRTHRNLLLCRQFFYVPRRVISTQSRFLLNRRRFLSDSEVSKHFTIDMQSVNWYLFK